jgi:hypothetical protein
MAQLEHGSAVDGELGSLETDADRDERGGASAAVRKLIELGYEPARVAAVLLQLPGSRARERGEPYALLTAERARRARLSNRRCG